MSINHWIVKNLVCTLFLVVGGLNIYAQKDKYLIYGYLFLVGKSSKSKRQNELFSSKENGQQIDRQIAWGVQCSV